MSFPDEFHFIFIITVLIHKHTQTHEYLQGVIGSNHVLLKIYGMFLLKQKIKKKPGIFAWETQNSSIDE